MSRTHTSDHDVAGAAGVRRALTERKAIGIGTAIRPTTTTGATRRLRAHLSDPLYRNSYALIVNTAITSVLGVAYWVVAAREYDAVEVGRASSLIAAMLLLSGIAQLNLNNALPRFLPIAGVATRRMVTTAYAAGAAISVLGGLAFILGAHWLNWGHGFVSGSWVVALWFLVAVATWCIFTLQDAVIAGLRQAMWIPVENAFFSLAKIGLLVVFAGVSERFGIFASWTIPVAVCIIPITVVIFKYFIPRAHAIADGRGLPVTRRDLRTYVAFDYTAALFQLGCNTLPQLLVAAAIGLRANAWFAGPWVVAVAFELLLANVGVALLVEGADGADTAALARRGFRLMLAVTVPTVTLLLVGAPHVLDVLGPQYAAHGSTVLRLIAIGMVPRTVVVLSLALCRLRRQTVRLILTQAASFALLLGISGVLVGTLGINGVGIAYIVAQLIVAIAVAPAVWREVHFRRSGVGEAS